MNSRIFEIYQPFPMSLESIYYAEDRDTIITITQETGEAKQSGELHRFVDVISGTDELTDTFANTKIFNIHVKDHKEVQLCQDKLSGYLCLFDKQNNFSIHNEKFKHEPRSYLDKSDKLSPTQCPASNFPEVILHKPNKARICSTKPKSAQPYSSGFGYNFYIEDIKNRILEEFIKTGSLPLPLRIQKNNCNNTIKKIIYCAGTAALAFGLFAFQNSLFSNNSNHSLPRP